MDPSVSAESCSLICICQTDKIAQGNPIQYRKISGQVNKLTGR
jgi:hypothetical protein